MRDLGRCFGLTGGVASGKSTVARMLEALGAKVIDADQLGHALIRAPLPAYQEIVNRFGAQVLDATGEIDRRKLGAIVFANKASLQELNAILHPRIIARVEDLAREYQAEDVQAIIIVDAALIYEAGIADRFAKVIVTWCRPEQQIERLMANADVSREEAEQRIAAQMPAEEKRHRADYVIDCSGTPGSTLMQVEALYPEMKQLAVRE